MNKTLLRILLCAALMGALLAQTVPLARAQTAQGEVVRFSDLDQKEILLDGPIDSASIDFYLPAHWKVQPGGIVHLNMRVFTGTESDQIDQEVTAGFIEVYINDIWLNTIPLTRNGEYSVDVDIPYSVWDLEREHTPQSLRIYLFDSVRCEMLWAAAQMGTWRGINVAIAPSSYLSLPHQDVPIATSLKQLPYPLYQNSFLPEKVLLIVPSAPTESELQSALAVAGGLGRMTNGDLEPVFLTADQAASTSLTGAHAIFIGDPAAFPQLSGVDLTGGSSQVPSTGPDDGLLRMLVSPVDPSTAWLLISGNSPAGLVKAAQAFAGGQVRVYGPENLAVVTEVVPNPTPSLRSDYTLADLGYEEQTYAGYGITYFAYWFDVPADQQIEEGAYFEMMFNNSALLNYDESGITVLLNDLFVGGVRMSDRTTNTTTTRFLIPAYMFRPGRNLLLLQANLEGITPCIPYEKIWVSIKPGSLLHIPTGPVTLGAVPQRSLTDFPALLFPTFEKLAFVLPRNDPGAWQIAADLAWQIGITSARSVIDPLAAYGDAVPPEWESTHSLIVVGRPSEAPVLASLADWLPASFPAGSDIAVEPEVEFLYDVPANVPVGYLQVLPSPWNPGRVILAVNGNDSQGLLSAQRTLGNPARRAELRGNLAVIYGNQVLVTQHLNEAGPAPAPTITVLGTPQAQGNGESGPFNLSLITIGLAILATFVVLALVVWAVNRRKRKA